MINSRVVYLLLPLFAAVMIVSMQLQQAWAEESDFIVYSRNNILTIYKFQTADMPFLAGGAKFLITPNPFSYTQAIMNDSRYDPEFDTSALLVTDNDPLFDSDPTDGIIELAGVKPGAYSVTEISGPAGFITNDNPAFGEIEDDRIATEFSSVQIFSIPINYTSVVTAIVEPPTVNSSSLAKLQSFAAKVNGADIGTGNLPPAIITNGGAGSKPNPVIFGNPVNGRQSATALFDRLGIPTYTSPSEASFGYSNSTYRLPPFIASDSGGGKVVFSPKLDKTFSGLNVNLDLSGQYLGLAKAKVESLNIPIGADGTDVGFKVKIQDQIPSGLPSSPLGDVALFLSIDTTGSVDFASSASFTSPPMITFSANKDLAGVPHTSDGCPDVRLYLKDPAANTWKMQSPPARNPSGDTATSCSFMQSLPHFSDYVVAGNNGSVPDNGGHDHGGSGGSSGGHSGHSGGSSGGSTAGHVDHDTMTPLSTAFLSKNTVNIGVISIKNTQGPVLGGTKVGQQVSIASTLTNVLQEHQPYAFIVQTVDENGFTTSVSWVSGHLDPGQVFEQSRSWTPDNAGSYEVSVMVWNGVMQSPQSLADKMTAEVKVVR